MFITSSCWRKYDANLISYPYQHHCVHSAAAQSLHISWTLIISAWTDRGEGGEEKSYGKYGLEQVRTARSPHRGVQRLDCH